MRTLPLLASAVVLSAALTGCGEDADTAVPGLSPTPAASTAAPGPSATPSPEGPAATDEIRLTGDGIDTPQQVVVFGTPFEQARAALTAALGEPARDTGEGPSFSEYGTCPGSTLRALEYGDGALFVLFGDVEGSELTMYQWGLTENGTPSSVPRASALVGDVTTFEFGVGTTVAALREGTATGTLEVREGDEVFGPSFTLEDQSAGFSGLLTGTGEQDVVTFVQAGEGCGE